MAFSGSTHNRIHDFTDDESNNIDPSAQRFDEEFDDVSSSLETRLAKDGTNSATADIPMGSNKITGLAAASANGDAVRYEQLPSSATNSAEGLVELATDAEARATASPSSTLVLTPDNLLGNRDLSTDGYLQVGPLVIQWAEETSSTDSNETFTFPTAFSNACLGVVINRQVTNEQSQIMAHTITTTGFDVNRDSALSNHTFNYLAIGY